MRSSSALGHAFLFNSTFIHSTLHISLNACKVKFFVALQDTILDLLTALLFIFFIINVSEKSSSIFDRSDMTHYSGPENSISNGNVIKFLEEEYMYSADYIVFLTCSLWFKLKYLFHNCYCEIWTSKSNHWLIR